MRVTCNTVEEFIECLRNEKSLFQNTVRVNLSERALDTDGIKYEITIQASAVVIVDETSQYLLEYGEDCGKNYKNGEGEEGTQNALKKKESIESYAKDREWKVLPGVIQI